MLNGAHYRVAVVGATGAVGETVLKVLAERGFPVGELVPFASASSRGKTVRFGDRELTCEVLSEEAVQGFDLAISSAGGSVSREWAPKFADAGALVIDKSSAWRDKKDVPLVVAGVNDDHLALALSDKGRRIIASPNCSTMQMIVALHPLHREAKIEEIVISTYQSVSGTGQRAIQELREQSAVVLANMKASDELGDDAPQAEISHDVYPHQIAFNALPQVDDFEPNGYTGEETKLMNETRKILSPDPQVSLDPSEIAITATCVRVPVFKAHSESVRVRTRRPIDADDYRRLLASTPGVVVEDAPGQSAYPLAVEAADENKVFVGRIRNDLGPDGDRCLNMWIVGDNLRKGAATNAVQIAEVLASKKLLGQRDRAAANGHLRDVAAKVFA